MKRVLAMLISVALVATLAVGGSIAYLTDTDSAVNVMEVGNVDIEQIELQRAEGVAHNKKDTKEGDLVTFEPGQKLYPAVPMHDAATDYTAEPTDLFYWGEYVTAEKAGNGLWNDDKLKGALDKFVFVENMGKSDAYYRTILAFECPVGMEYSQGPDKEFMMNINGNKLFTWEEVGYADDIDGSRYLLMVATYNEVLKAGEISRPSLLQVVMTHNANNDDMKLLGDSYEILAYTQAVQVDNMTEAFNSLSVADKAKYDNSAAKYALVKAFGEITTTAHPWLDGIYTLVTTDGELKAAIKDENVKSIRVQGDLTYDWGEKSYANSEALLLEGKTFFGADKDASLTFAGYGSANPIKGVTLKDITIKDETKGDNEGAWEHGHLEFESLIASNVRFDNSIMLSGESKLINCTMDNKVAEWYGAWVESGNTTFKDCTFTGTRAIKIHEAYKTDVASVTVDNCSFDLTEKPGVVIGDVNAATSVSIINSDFDCRAGDQGKYIYESDTDVTTFRFNESNNNVVKSKVEVADDNAMDAAIKDGASTLILGSGNYIIPDSAQGKNLNIIGTGNTVIATQDDGSYEGCDYSLDGATVTFEGITINTDSTTYTGYARMKGTYKNCTINGTYTLYGNSVFEDCTFNVSGDVYNIWTWGAPEATFTRCTFNSDGKAMLLYGQANTKLTINNCTFNDKGGLTDLKAAIEIGNDYGTSYELIVNNTTVNGYEINDKGINTGTTLWGNKNSMGTDKLNVVVDGVDVY